MQIVTFWFCFCSNFDFTTRASSSFNSYIKSRSWIHLHSRKNAYVYIHILFLLLFQMWRKQVRSRSSMNPGKFTCTRMGKCIRNSYRLVSRKRIGENPKAEPFLSFSFFFFFFVFLYQSGRPLGREFWMLAPLFETKYRHNAQSLMTRYGVPCSAVMAN